MGKTGVTGLAIQVAVVATMARSMGICPEGRFGEYDGGWLVGGDWLDGCPKLFVIGLATA